MFADPMHQRNAWVQRRRLERQTASLFRQYEVRGWLGGRWWRSDDGCHCGRSHCAIVVQSKVAQSRSGLLNYKLEWHCPLIFWGRLKLARPDLYIPVGHFLGPTDGWEDVIGGVCAVEIPKGLSLEQVDMYIKRRREEAEEILAALEEINPEAAKALRLAQIEAAREVLRRGRVLLRGPDEFVL
jgi:hypothetical protein